MASRRSYSNGEVILRITIAFVLTVELATDKFATEDNTGADVIGVVLDVLTTVDVEEVVGVVLDDVDSIVLEDVDAAVEVGDAFAKELIVGRLVVVDSNVGVTETSTVEVVFA